MFHDDLTKKVIDIEAKHAAGNMTLSIVVMVFLADWLAHHISDEDKQIVKHINASAAASNSQQTHP